MDVRVHRYGPRVAALTSLAALGLNLLVAFFFLASRVPGAWGEGFADMGGAAINQALGNTTGGTWLVVLGSSAAFIVSSLLSNVLNWAAGERMGDRGFGTFALRSHVSTVLAQLADNITLALSASRAFFG